MGISRKQLIPHSENCPFCEIISGRRPGSIIVDDELAIAFMDSSPVTQGHTLVIPKKHCSNLKELDEYLGMHLFRITLRVAQAITESGVKCEGISLFLADGEGARQQVPHVHIHIFPRYRGDPFKITDFWNTSVSRHELDSVANLIRLAYEKKQK